MAMDLKFSLELHWYRFNWFDRTWFIHVGHVSEYIVVQPLWPCDAPNYLCQIAAANFQSHPAARTHSPDASEESKLCVEIHWCIKLYSKMGQEVWDLFFRFVLPADERIQHRRLQWPQLWNINWGFCCPPGKLKRKSYCLKHAFQAHAFFSSF